MILPLAEIAQALRNDARNRAMLTLLYASAVRVRELCNLEWKDLQAQDDGEGQVTVFGKGGKTRSVQLPASVWKLLLELRPSAKTTGHRHRSGIRCYPGPVRRDVQLDAGLGLGLGLVVGSWKSPDFAMAGVGATTDVIAGRRPAALPRIARRPISSRRDGAGVPSGLLESSPRLLSDRRPNRTISSSAGNPVTFDK
jgi:integrase